MEVLWINNLSRVDVGQGDPEVAGALACVGAASHRSDLGLKRLRREHKVPEWLD